MAPEAVKVRVRVGQIPPTADAVFAMVNTGSPGLTVTVITTEEVQPKELVPCTVKLPVAVGETRIELVVAPVFQVYEFTLPAVKVAELPAQMAVGLLTTDTPVPKVV